jgi:hypothetical protein
VRLAPDKRLEPNSDFALKSLGAVQSIIPLFVKSHSRE